MTLVNIKRWSTFLESRPKAHILQTPEWGSFKRNHGWHPKYLLVDNTGAQILFRKLPFGLTIGYIPKGPVGNSWEKIIPEAISLCQKEKALFTRQFLLTADFTQLYAIHNIRLAFCSALH